MKSRKLECLNERLYRNLRHNGVSHETATPLSIIIILTITNFVTDTALIAYCVWAGTEWYTAYVSLIPFLGVLTGLFAIDVMRKQEQNEEENASLKPALALRIQAAS